MNLVKAYYLVWVRISAYFFIPFFTLCLTQTETWSGDTWNTTHWFLKVRILVAAFVAGLTAFAAYIDNSFRTAQGAYQTLTEADRAIVAAETTAKP